MDNPILALIAGFIAMVFVITSYFVKNKSLYLVFQALCITFLVVSYFFTVQFFAMIGVTIGLIRTLVFFAYERKDKDAPLWVAFVLAVATVASYFIVNYGILKTAQPLDVLCLVALVMYVFIFRIRNLKIVRFTMLAPTILFILFNTLTQAVLFVSLSYVFELTADVVSIFRYHILPTHKEETEESKEK